MNSKFLKTLLLAAVIVGGIWVLFHRDQIREPSDVVRLLQDNLPDLPQLGAGDTAGSDYGYNRNYPADFNSPMPNVGATNLPAGVTGGLPQSTFNAGLEAGSRLTGVPAQLPTARSRANVASSGYGGRYVTHVIRIASFRLDPKTTGQQADRNLDLIADICRRFDAIAFQEISGNDNTWLARLTDRMNAMGAVGTQRTKATGGREASKHSSNPVRGDYFFLSDVGRNQGQQSSMTQAAIVFNRQTLELDDSRWYTVNDPDRLLSRQPIVAWFRTRGLAPDQAFTFNLVNLKISAAQPEQELAYLGQLFRAIRNDGRNEDDIVLAGDFHADDASLEPLRQQAGLAWVVSNRPTNTLKSAQFDNLIYNPVATIEFTGRGGVFDFLRHYNLGLEEALSISDHLPVWAEFSVFENGTPTGKF